MAIKFFWVPLGRKTTLDTHMLEAAKGTAAASSEKFERWSDQRADELSALLEQGWHILDATDLEDQIAIYRIYLLHKPEIPGYPTNIPG